MRGSTPPGWPTRQDPPVASDLAAGDTAVKAFGGRPADPESSSMFPGRAALSLAARGILDELRLRSGAGARTAVTGLGTRLKAERVMEGARPLDLRQLSGMVEIDRENLSARVEAGLSFEELSHQLKEAGFYLDLPALKGSVGGLIASKACPDIRNSLLGLEIALADGSLLELGGKTVKNVAGYDAVKLFCGSLALRRHPGRHLRAVAGKVPASFCRNQGFRNAHCKRRRSFPAFTKDCALEPDAIQRRLKKT